MSRPLINEDGIDSNGAQWYPCPCCGYYMFDEPPGSYVICSICFWEDDAIQLETPTYSGGANTPSLIESQANFASLGAMEERLLDHVRKPDAQDMRDPRWRPATEKDCGTDDEPYYWRRDAVPEPGSPS